MIHSIDLPCDIAFTQLSNVEIASSKKLGFFIKVSFFIKLIYLIYFRLTVQKWSRRFNRLSKKNKFFFFYL